MVEARPTNVKFKAQVMQSQPHAEGHTEYTIRFTPTEENCDVFEIKDRYRNIRAW